MHRGSSRFINKIRQTSCVDGCPDLSGLLLMYQPDGSREPSSHVSIKFLLDPFELLLKFP
jgi:hypothetical protein